MFGWQKTDFAEVFGLADQVAPHAALWSLAAHVTRSYPNWMSGPLTGLGTLGRLIGWLLVIVVYLIGNSRIKTPLLTMGIVFPALLRVCLFAYDR